MVFGGIDVTVVGQLAERVGHASLDPAGSVRWQTKIASQLVRGLETNAPDVLRQAIWIGLHHIERFVAVGLVDLYREAGRHAVRL